MKDVAHQNTNKVIEKLENEINILYSQAKKELQKELNNSLDWSKILNMKDKHRRLAESRKRNRLNKLISKMSYIIKNKNKVALGLIDGKLIDVFADNYNWGVYSLENMTGFNLDFTLYSREAVAELLKETTPVFTKMAYLGAKDLTTIRSDLRRQLTVEILKGSTIKDIAKKIDKVTDKNNNGSTRIARTEIGRIENSGRMKAFKHGEKKGLKLEKEWISTIDRRTRVNHRHLQGETVGLDELFSNGLRYPNDPNGSSEEVINCRCTHIAEFEGIEKGAAELELDEKLKNMSYAEWKDTKKAVKKKAVKSQLKLLKNMLLKI